jgi:hypothetical protein
MKIIRFVILGFYIVFVIPMCAVMLVSLVYGGVVETMKIIKKNNV